MSLQSEDAFKVTAIEDKLHQDDKTPHPGNEIVNRCNRRKMYLVKYRHTATIVLWAMVAMGLYVTQYILPLLHLLAIYVVQGLEHTRFFRQIAAVV